MFGVGQFFGKMFGTDKAAASLIDNVSAGLDKLVYTGEERAEDAARSVTEARAMVIDWMRATSGQNLARRVIALFVSCVWGFMYIATVALSVAAVWADKPEQLVASATIIREAANQMTGAMMLILAFYFAAPHMGVIVGRAMDRFGGSGRGSEGLK